MKIFKNLEEYCDDDLICIAYGDSENWQKDAVDFAKHLLLERGVSEDFAKLRVIEIGKEIDIFFQREFDERKNESFSIIELILMFVFWIKYVLQDWHLGEEGYVRKQKQRLYAIGAGAFISLVLFLNILLSYDTTQEKRITEINQIATADSIAVSKINWTGFYVFQDTSMGQANKIVWELSVHKDDSKHMAELKLISKSETIIVSCVGLIKKDDFEFYPDTTYSLFNGQTISYYDRLFTFVSDGNDIYTSWGKLTPFFHLKSNNIGQFKKTIVAIK